ncbi:phosphatidylinositol kinase- protein kinase tor1 [Coemansia sp. RSA 720]|nr:phosphatidylinositol kinase- protein kinase tor1 [Coemansia sp. RSA 720]
MIEKRWASVMSSVETDINRCLEWLGSERNEVRRMTALRVIEVLCNSNLISLHLYISKIFTELRNPLRNQRHETRMAAARTLGACMELIPMSERNVRNPWLNFLYEELQRNNQLESVEGYHGALLISKELLQHGGVYMQSHFGQVCNMALKLKEYRDPIVRKAAIALLPVLAHYSPQEFTRVNTGNSESMMGRACNYLITLSRTSDRDRAAAFLALGNIAQYCSTEYRSFLEPTTRAIRDALIQRAKMRIPPSEADETVTAVLQTIATLATAMGPALTRYLRDILDLMFTAGLSQALCDSLLVLEREVSQLQSAIQGRLLDMVSIILVGVPFRPSQQSLDDLEQRMGTMSMHYTTAQNGHRSGAAANGNSVNGASSRDAYAGSVSDSTLLVVRAANNIHVTNDTLVLALRTLRIFDFSEENLSEFVRNEILRYLTNSSAAVRKEAIHAVSHIVMADPLYRSMAGAGVEVASEVVQRLVSAAVIDVDRDVRLMAVQMLKKGICFDFHMGKAQNIQDLFLLLNDEVFEVRLTVLAVIGRLANMNPAHVMPSLRRMVVQLLTELEFARSNRESEECIQLLMVLVRAAENWVRPYVGDIFSTILPRINNAPAQLASKLLDTVAVLARVGGSDLVPYSDELLASIIHALSDTSNATKRMSALQALNNCASFCGLVIDPYIEYPDLFKILTDILKSQPDSKMQQEVMRTIGALGAIDPHRFKDATLDASDMAATNAGATNSTSGINVNSGSIINKGAEGTHRAGNPHARKADGKPKKKQKKQQQNVMTEKQMEPLVGGIPTDSYGTTFSSDAYYTQLSVNALLRILENTSDTTFHREAVEALNHMFAPVQYACAPFLDRVVPAILLAMDVAPAGGSEFYISALVRLVSIARQLVRPFLEPIFKLFSVESLGSERQQAMSIGLIEVLAEALSGNFGPHIATVLPFLMAIIDRDASELHQPTLRVLPALQILSPSLEGYLFLVMPRLITLLDIAIMSIAVVEATLKCIASIVGAVNCSSFSSRIVLTLVRLLQCSPPLELQTAAIDVLCTMMEQLQDEFVLFMPTIKLVMSKRGIDEHARYERYSRLLFSGRLVPKEPQRTQLRIQGDTAQAGAAGPALGHSSDGLAKQEVGIMQLRRAWTSKPQKSKDGWMRWLHAFTYELLEQSPSPALRACSSLAKKHSPLSKELFNAAFVSCWTVLPGQYQQEIIASLQSVASNLDVPADILQTILGLAGFMEHDEKQIPIDLKRLGDYASRCHALAKELHYKEAEWTLEKNYDTIEKLIELNQNLDLQDSAIGMLEYVRKERPDVQESVVWYQRLQQWDKALEIYQEQEAERGPSFVTTRGQIGCLFELSDWEALVPIFERIWSGNDQKLQLASASIGMSMAWAMGDIDRMEFYLSTLPNKSRDKSFCKALLAVYRNNFEDAAKFISNAREEMEANLSSHITESYSRGYSQVFMCQMLTELEEVVMYKMAPDDRERQVAIISTWRHRLSGIQQDVGMWQKLLRLRSMVLRPILDLDTWIKYVNMSRKSGQMHIARDAILQLVDDEALYMEEIHRGEVDALTPKFVLQAQEYMQMKMQQPQGLQGSRLPLGLNGRNTGQSSSSWEGRTRRFSIANGSNTSANGPLDVAIRLSQQPALVYMYLKYKWAANEQRDAYQMLEVFASDYASRIGFDLHNPDAFAEHIDARVLANLSGHAEAAEDTRTIHLLARFYFKQAEWLTTVEQTVLLSQEAQAKAGLSTGELSYARQFVRRESIGVRRGRGSMSRSSQASRDGIHASDDGHSKQDAQYLYELKGRQIDKAILEAYHAATVLDRKWYKAWHQLALRHFLETQRYQIEHGHITEDMAVNHVVPAVHGFFRAIQLSKSDTTLQDTLRLLTAWFDYCEFESVAQAVRDGYNSVSIRTWLQVIPQILARIHIKAESTRRLVQQLLVEVGKSHPHAIMFSLYVAARSEHVERSLAAKDVLAKLHDMYPQLVEETELVSRELIRITLPFPEMWTKSIYTLASKYNGGHGISEIARELQSHYKRLYNPETLREYQFVQEFGKDLSVAYESLLQYYNARNRTHSLALLKQAIDMYWHINCRIERQYPFRKHLVLEDISPILHQCRDMSVAVPGSYNPDVDLITIQSFKPDVEVHRTAQLPRQMCIQGSDGNEYTFLLKGRDDLRLDERVMQLFGLINSLLSKDSETARRSLAIERFPVVPLSSNSGLIGFYSNSNSLNDIVTENRKAVNQPNRLELNLALQFTPNWVKLTTMQKVESFEYALSNTPGNDLQRAMWYKSSSAEVWLEHRTNYTRSLAVMSIAGYILGLGDRHPSNILIHKRTGKVVHIDLGDCFEITWHREQFPEKVPFRLTRMLIKPMEVCSTDGIFKHTANHTMRVLRANRESLMAVLEAFVYDPLVSWAYLQETDNSAGTNYTKQYRTLSQDGQPDKHASKRHSSSSTGGLESSTKQSISNNDYYFADTKGWNTGNPKAHAIVKRIHDKLVGTDFSNEQLDVSEQIEKLIRQATASENLAVLYSGWVPFW